MAHNEDIKQIRISHIPKIEEVHFKLLELLKYAVEIRPIARLKVLQHAKGNKIQESYTVAFLTLNYSEAHRHCIRLMDGIMFASGRDSRKLYFKLLDA
jgi:hypothetical protein